MSQDKIQIKKSLKFSIFDGAFAGVMTGFTQEYFIPFLLLLGASVREVGMLNAFPNFFASLIQLKSADLVEKAKSRKKIINLFVFLQAFVLLFMAVMAFCGKTGIMAFIILVIFFAGFGAFTIPAWGSLMSDLVEKDKRGEYFGYRSRVVGGVTVGATFIAGLILHNMKSFNIFYAFALIFSGAFIARIISWCFLKKIYEPSLGYSSENHFTFLSFVAGVKKSNFARFVLFIAVMNFSVNLASPFFGPLMLNDLKFSYFLYTIVTIAATLTVYSVIRRWGRHADKIGNLKIIKITAPLIGVIPLFWILSRNPVFLIFAQIFSGFLWAGFNLCASNFIYDAVTPEKRTRCIAYFNVLNGFALCSGALIGGFLIPKLPPLFGYNILTILLISAVLRIITALFLPLGIKEVRHVEKIKNNELFFSMAGIKPILGIDERKVIRL